MVAPLTPALEKQNFENMIWFYQDELRAVVGGQPFYELFTGERLKHNLKRLGILTPKQPIFARKDSYKGNVRLFEVSPKARALLEIFILVLMVLSLPFL
ncbi:hypothetical protein ES703_108038 [subsurface metagenome]